MADEAAASETALAEAQQRIAALESRIAELEELSSQVAVVGDERDQIQTAPRCCDCRSGGA